MANPHVCSLQEQAVLGAIIFGQFHEYEHAARQHIRAANNLLQVKGLPPLTNEEYDAKYQGLKVGGVLDSKGNIIYNDKNKPQRSKTYTTLVKQIKLDKHLHLKHRQSDSLGLEYDIVFNVDDKVSIKLPDGSLVNGKQGNLQAVSDHVREELAINEDEKMGKSGWFRWLVDAEHHPEIEKDMLIDTYLRLYYPITTGC